MTALPVRSRPSPNCGPRRNGLRPEFIVLHHTAMTSASAALDRLCDPEAEVSAHYLIAGDGGITRLVPEEERAWHAGAGEWRGLDDINSRSVGIELDNRGDHPYAAPQMDVLEALLREIMERWKIGPEGVIGHSDMAPGRKSDPGARFDWARLARQGLARGPGKVPEGVEISQTAFVAHARAAGFTAEVTCEQLIAATRLRFAPWRRGDLVAADFAL